MPASRSVLSRCTRAAAVLSVLACQGSEPTSNGPTPSTAPASATAPPSAVSTRLPANTPAVTGQTPATPPLPATAASSTRAGALAPACRVISLSGPATHGGRPLRVGETFGGAALELAAGARLHFVHVSSARAWGIEGPARLTACEGGAEEIVLARGVLRAEPGSGVRPGAEVWVGTPFGALRYADATASIDVGERQLFVRVSTGRVWFTPLGGDSPDERPVATSATFSSAPYRLPEDRAISRCGQDAGLAEQRARSLLAPAPRPLGERAAEHVRARQRARASCLGARAVALAAPGDDAPSAGAELARYDALWRGVPDRAAIGRP